MESLVERHWKKLDATATSFIRGMMNTINWNGRLTGIKGARGVGKTTLILQYIKLNHRHDPSALYVSLDNLWFSNNTLTSLADYFVKRGGKFLFLDEVHKYNGWAQEIKNLYDDYPELKIVFTGSSLLNILNARADLSRRAIVHTMQGLSFREFLTLSTGITFNTYTLEQILNNHIKISGEIVTKVKPLQFFDKYLKSGYYPFFHEMPTLYHQRIEEIINMIIDIELPVLRGVEPGNITKIKKLLQIISESAPFIPNISKLSEHAGINRVTLLSYLRYLNEVRLINTIYRNVRGITRLQKPDKLFMENTNILFALAPENSEKGTLRETFLVNQLAYEHRIEYPETGDLLVNGKYLIEIGGIKKNKKQLRSYPNAYIASDEIEYGSLNRVPLWLFGFLY